MKNLLLSFHQQLFCLLLIVHLLHMRTIYIQQTIQNHVCGHTQIKLLKKF